MQQPKTTQVADRVWIENIILANTAQTYRAPDWMTSGAPLIPGVVAPEACTLTPADALTTPILPGLSRLLLPVQVKVVRCSWRIVGDRFRIFSCSAIFNDLTEATAKLAAGPSTDSRVPLLVELEQRLPLAIFAADASEIPETFVQIRNYIFII